MLFPQGKSSEGSFESSHYVERTRDGSLLHPSQYVIAPAAKELPHPLLSVSCLFLSWYSDDAERFS